MNTGTDKCITGRVFENCWDIIAVGKHIIADDALASGDEGVGVDEAAEVGIVIPGLEVIEAGFSVLGLTAMLDYALDTHTKPQGFRVGI